MNRTVGIVGSANRTSGWTRGHGWLLAAALIAGCSGPNVGVAQAPATGPGPESAGTAHASAPVAENASQVAGAPRALRPEDFKGLPWRSVGPANMGGRVADIALAPGNAKTFYVAFGTGGLFKTTNAGTTFAPVFDKEATASIGSVVVVDAPPDWPGWKDEPAEPTTKEANADKGKAKIVWVGTGEGNGRNSSSWGTGVYRSTDGGGTWKHLGLTDSHDIPRLAVDPRNPDVCYVAALGHLWGPNKERGVYKTTDGGKTWSAMLQIDENTGACDVILDPSNPDTVYAAMYMRRRTAWSFQSGGPNGGIYRSTDGGANWTKLSNGLPKQTGRIGLDLYRKDPRIVYATVESDEGGWGAEPFANNQKVGGLFRSEDRGSTWTRVSDLNMRAFYFSKVRIDPTDDQRIYSLGWGLAISDDGGKHFRAGGARLPHVDMHAFVIDPADRDHLLMGTDGGVYASHDRAKTWDFFNSMAVGEFYNIAIDLSDPYRIAGGLQDNGNWVGVSGSNWNIPEDQPGGPAGLSNADWNYIYDGDGYHMAFDPLDRNIVYAEAQGGEIARIHLDTARRKLIRPAPKEGQPRHRFNWNSPFFISPHNPTTLYLGGNYVFKLTDRGDRWERISPDLSTRNVEKIETVGSEAETHGTVVSLAESPLMAGLLWAGTDDGLVHVTFDDGKTWTNVTPPQTGGRYISRIEASHHERDATYVAIDGHRSNDFEPYLVMTIDAGKTWTMIGGDGAQRLPSNDIVKVVREDLHNKNALFVGTERAAYVSIDRGQSWVKLNGDSLPTVAVDDLAIHPRERDLLAGTHGRSIYVLDDASPLSQLTREVVESEFHLFEILPAKPRLFIEDHDGLWSDRFFRAKNPPMGARITYWVRDYTGEDVKLTIVDAKDNTVRELTGSNRPGLNRVIWDLQRDKPDRFANPEEWLGQTQFVPAGDYTVKVTYGKKTAKGTINVLPAPGPP